MSSISPIRDVLNSNGYSNRKSNKVTSIAIEDQIIESVEDLVDPEYKLWFITRLRVVGKSNFLESAERARKYGKNPKKLFSHLIR
jgi:hypothetical protein